MTSEVKQTTGTETIKPEALVTIILPAYNVADTISETLLSVLGQTMAQTEIIVVNDASTDHTQEVIDTFIKAYPQRIHCIQHQENKGLSGARKTGLEHATAPYILFVDTDDAVSADICDVLYPIMEEKKLDLLYYPLMRYDLQTNRSEYMYPPNTSDKAVLIEKGYAAFVSAMYRREFLLQHKNIVFVNRHYEDAAATPVLISKAKRIGTYQKKALYLYYYGREGSITQGIRSKENMEGCFYADFYGWDKIDRPLKTAYAKRVAKRARKIFPEAYDCCIEHMREVWQYLEPYRNVLDSYTLKCYQDALALPLKTRIPKKVYVNGFLQEEIKDFDQYIEQARKTYLYDPEVIVLDELTCDVTRLPSWIKTNEDKGLFMALDAIERDGGVYVAPYVSLVNSVNREAYSNAFFIAGTDRQVIPAVFGAEPHQYCVVRMLQLMEEREYQSVPYCMTTVLSGEAGVRLNGYEEAGLDNVHILPIGETTIMGKEGKCIFTLDYSCFKQLPEDVIAMPRALWDLAIKRYVDTELSSIKADTGAGKQSSAAQREISSAAQREIEKFKKSRAYRYAKKYYRVRDKVKKVAKKILRR